MLAAFVLAFIQASLEIFPIGGIAVSYLLGLYLHVTQPDLLSYVMWGNLGIGIGIFYLYRQEWLALLNSIYKRIQRKTLGQSEYHTYVFTICFVGVGVVATLLFGFFANFVFNYPFIIAILLVINGYAFFFANKIYSKFDSHVGHLHPYQGMIVALIGALGVFPGISRTGFNINTFKMWGKDESRIMGTIYPLIAPIFLFTFLFNVSLAKLSLDSFIYLVTSIAVTIWVLPKAKILINKNKNIFPELAWLLGIIFLAILKMLA